MNTLFGRKTNTKRALSHLMMTSALVAAGTLVLSSSAMAAPWDEMTGPGFTNTSLGANTTNIVATTANGKASGTGNLDILTGQTVNINAKLFVARDNRPTIQTQILGNLNSNGTVVLIDRNGIVFGKDSRVDVGSLIATTGDLDDNQALANGNTPLLFSNFGIGEIVNDGSIEASGLVAFVAPTVRNNGVINAKLGRVSMAAGQSTATVDLYGDGLVEFAIDPAIDTTATTLSENTGSITGGKIRMTAASAKTVADSIVNMQGILTANSATVNSKGQIVLSAGTVKIGSSSSSASVKGNTQVKATQVDLGLTIDGAVSGSASSVKVLSNNAKIAQALNIIDANGVIDVAAGTYNEHLIVNKVGVTLNGAKSGVSGSDTSRGTGETIIVPNSPGVTVSADYITIDGLTFTGATGTDGYGIYVNGADNVTLKNNIISDTSRYGIFVNNSSVSNILNNSIDQTNSHGIYIYGSNGVNISGNYVGMLGADGNVKGDGIRVVSSENISITDNYINNTANVTGNLGSGIYIGKSTNSDIAGNTISKAGWDGIKIEQSSSNQVTNNLISEITRTGITLNSSSSSLVNNNRINNIGHRGFWAVGNENLSIANNQVSSAKLEGLFSDHNFDLTIQDNTLTSTGLDGLHIKNNTGVLSVINNDVSEIGLNGIYIYNSTDANITNNQVNKGKQNGIYIDSSNGADITNNQIGLVGGAGNIEGDGIRAVLSNNLLIANNIIRDISSTDPNVGSGIYIGNSNESQITNNDISLTSWDGIKVEYGRANIIKDNLISDVIRTGIALNDTTDVTAAGNTISHTGRRGFWSLGNENLNISNNFIANTVLEGIISDKDSNTSFDNNTITQTGRDGVHVTNASGFISISGNTINNPSLNGIYVHNYGMLKYSLFSGGNDITLNISGNKISDSNIGVKLEGINGDLNVAGNTITNSNYDGVYAQNVNQDGNYYPYPTLFAQIEGEGEGDVVAPLVRQLTIANNDIDNSGSNGIELDNAGGLVTIDSNNITNSGYNGILAYNDAAPIYIGGDDYIGGEYARQDFFAEDYYYGSTPIELHIVNNTIENFASIDTEVFERSEQKIKNTNFFGFAAVNVDVSGDGYVELSGNTLGNNFEYGLVAYSGSIDLTGATNTIQNTNIGMGFYPTEGAPESDSTEYFDYLASQLSLVNDTIGTTAFIDQSELFVDLGYGAMYAPGTPTQLDGNSATYTLAGVTIDPATNGGVTSDEYDVLESFINHYVDAQNRGQFFFNILPPVSAARTIDQKDVIRDTFGIPTPQLLGGNLTITGLPLISTTGAGGTTPTGGFNPAAIEPAAGDETADAGTTPAANDVANIQPAAGGDTACWSDATASLGQGAPVTFNYGTTGTALLQNAASCGTGQAQGQSL